MSTICNARINLCNDNDIVVGHSNVTTIIFKHLNMRIIMITTIAILHYEIRHAGAYSVHPCKIAIVVHVAIWSCCYLLGYAIRHPLTIRFTLRTYHFYVSCFWLLCGMALYGIGSDFWRCLALVLALYGIGS